MKSVLISIQPKWCELIASGKKTIAVRKTAPKLETPFKCYIYATKSDKYLLDQEPNGTLFCWDKKSHHYPFKDEKNFEELYNGKVIGEFVCDKIEIVNAQCSDSGIDLFYDDCKKYGCLSQVEVEKYFGVYDEDRTRDLRAMKGNGYAWHISKLKIYDKPKGLGEFKFPCQRGYNDVNNAWCYREKGVRLTMCKYNDMENSRCSAYITRPPQSWCYVEE